jgi:O-antigen/teichoic acid export membrane protein
MLGPKWYGLGTPLAILALYAGARSITQLFGFLFVATRQSRFAMWTSVALAGLLIIGFIVGSRWGGGGIAAAWLVIHPGVSCYSFSRVRSAIDLSAREYLGALRLGVDGSVIMALSVLAFQRVADGWPAALRLTGSIVLGAATFAAATWLLHGHRFRQIIAWLKRVRSGATAA